MQVVHREVGSAQLSAGGAPCRQSAGEGRMRRRPGGELGEKDRPYRIPGANRVHDSLNRGQAELVEPPSAGLARGRADARALEQPRRIGTRRYSQPTQWVRRENGECHLGDRLHSLCSDRPMAAAAPTGETPQLVGVYFQDVNLPRRKYRCNLLVTVKEQKRLTLGAGKRYIELLIDPWRISAAKGQTGDFAAPGFAGYVTRVARLHPVGSAPKARRAPWPRPRRHQSP